MLNSTRERAMTAQVDHRFVPGLGYLVAGPSDALPKGTNPVNRCTAPTRPETGSAHRLNPPGGGMPIVFYWVATEAAWARPGGFRMAFTAAHLSSHGWTYDSPV